MDIRASMDALADLIRDGVDRPVSCDPRNIAPPCVLVCPPKLTPDATLCGTRKLSHTVLVIGLPGAYAEIDPLSRLLDQTLTALEDGPGWTFADLVAYESTPQGAEPAMAYQITTEVLA